MDFIRWFKFLVITFTFLTPGAWGILNKVKIPWFKLAVNSEDYTLDDFISSMLVVNDTSTRSDDHQSLVAEDPCENYFPLRPKLDGAMRVSEQKCLEYVTDMVNRENISKREVECKNKHGQSTGRTRITISKKHSTKRGEYSHMVALGWKTKKKNFWKFFCGGTLISDKFVLTAAHCASLTSKQVARNHLTQADPHIVRLGTRMIQRRFTDVKIKQFIQHADWKSPVRYNDIGLVELATVVRFSKFIQPACVSARDVTTQTATITGWGATDESSTSLSSVLQSGEVDIIDSSKCDSLLKPLLSRNWWGVMPHQICAGKLEGGVDTCQGDSGGPLQVKLQETQYEGTMHVVIGVTSFGFKCGVKDTTGVLHEYKPFLTRYQNGTLVREDTITFHDAGDKNHKNRTTPKEEDPCDKFVPLKPRFAIKGARISDLKCAEYMLDLVNREAVREREEKCKQKQGIKVIKKGTQIIISKYSTRPGQYPHMAALGWQTKRNEWEFLCGGSLISPNFVLTAAHCSSTSNDRLERKAPDIVRLGARDIQGSTKFEKSVDIRIKNFISHPSRNVLTKYYDIALVELDSSITFSQLIQPACLEGKFYTSRHNVTVTGWGVTDTNTFALSSRLQAGDVDIIDSQYCDLLLRAFHDRKWWGLMDHQMCAGKIEGGVDTCQGDSGGPLQVKLKETKYEGSMHMVIGVTSFGIKCGKKDQPGIYTKVSSFLDWIESVVWPK
ncbi:unnamed protein product [Leptosia nina]|uniref:Peptidase S1 domain-containing protein n=1 Tax=Leptosia nina TaxID=320188 RepID=A0AAV1IY21_9NEOP